MAVINTNIKALYTQSALKRTEGAQSKAMAQLSTGKRINTAADDAAGLAISTRMTTQIRGLNQAVRNAGDGISMIQTAEGATNEITDMMQRMRELAVQAVNDTNDNAQRSYLDLEFQQLKQEIVHISESTQWNGFPLLNGTAGERVGEMPVFKTTSVSQLSDVFVNPTTTRTVSGNDAGEIQTLDFTSINDAPMTGTITVGGVAVTIGDTTIQGDTSEAKLFSFTAAIKTALEADPSFDPTTSNRLITQTADGQLTITYAATDGNIGDIPVDVGSTGVTTAVATTRAAVATSARTGAAAVVSPSAAARPPRRKRCDERIVRKPMRYSVMGYRILFETGPSWRAVRSAETRSYWGSMGGERVFSGANRSGKRVAAASCSPSSVRRPSLVSFDGQPL